jgi:hypothetical protein
LERTSKFLFQFNRAQLGNLVAFPAIATDAPNDLQLLLLSGM